MSTYQSQQKISNNMIVISLYRVACVKHVTEDEISITDGA